MKIKSKKSLGQNFLTDKNILENIVKLVNIENEAIMEVGPGTGNLSNFLLRNKPKKFYAIEKDKYLALDLKKNLKKR